ncbi:MAG TPA: type II toxin-antitoxin system HipA family toxin [Candidatus Elarobacter sp.]|nr:type II toxin-antitoxin system HipA family toxin [Candidatus Elarobacter sp.]
MRLQPGEPVHVTLAYGPGDEVAAGRLAIDRGRAFFEYDEAFVASGARINPAWGQPNRTLIAAKNPRAFKGLHGIFADSLPDAWGIELMRRRLAEQNVSYDALNALDRLALVGTSGAGAVVYRPDYAEHGDGSIDLDALAAGAIELDGTATEVVEELALLGGSSGGARPKVFVARNAAGALIAGSGAIPDGFEAYIVKFRGSMDRVDIGPLEAAYADMARAAGIEVAPTLLIAATEGPGYFATRRFDRGPGNTRIHMLSVAAIIETDWTEPSIDYVQLITATRGITRDHGYAEQMFRRMVFNVLAANRDDHTKQHTFLQARDGAWTLSPAYDLTLSSGPNGEHYLAVNGRGKNITLADLLAVARETSIKEPRARGVIEDVRAAIADFPARARAYDVSNATIAEFKRETGAFNAAPAAATAPPRTGRRPRR